jgi:diaminohydroxyphosphoribosylaminopyrimidine deaminase/5-amino-6-(5-phosphoribosylamino)uracil reductase
MKTNHNNYLNLAFNLARINLGKTKHNPSVGCVVVKNNSVISTGYTSNNGRPHAEFNALNKMIKFDNSDLYVTMEPCTHYGITPPCTNIIINKKIKNVYFSTYDIDKRTAKKSQQLLIKKNIKIFKKNLLKINNFYKSYFLNKKKNLPFVDAKIALSRDYYTIDRKKKWITNISSRNRVHLIRSEYDSIISTSASVNKDNSLLNCRLNGFNINKTDLIIIDLKIKIKKNLRIFDLSNKRKIFIVTNIKENKKKSKLRKLGVKFIQINHLNSKNDFINLFKNFQKKGFNRILVESGLTFLNQLLQKRLINNLYIFQSSNKLKKNGFNNSSINIIKKMKLPKKVNVNLYEDKLYKVIIK